ncbi:c-type cytochrome [Flavisolibacter nicotianae]|uniref:c-type cytochrome n=1 Tax=Flavisolibacter nicotianae TaxID=2364882 RepID=UPI0013C3EF45|nr:c-type cytochrome [Flavisolibacter nicotianae]
MRNTKRILSALLSASVLIWSCESANKNVRQDEEPLVKASSTKEEMIDHGRLLVTAGGCNDCHSPKSMGPYGPAVDSAKALSGHPASMPTPPVIESALKPGGWVLMGPDVTSFVGPWGISYAANLTPDSATGIGAWTEGEFIQTLRKGKHLGADNGRPLLPPMPWPGLARLSDQDLKSIFAYLQTLTPVSNRVPGPVSPDKAVVAK